MIQLFKKNEKPENFDDLDYVEKNKVFNRIFKKKYNGGWYRWFGIPMFFVAVYHHFIITEQVDNFWSFAWRKDFPEEFLIFAVSTLIMLIALVGDRVAFFKTKRDLDGYAPPHSGT